MPIPHAPRPANRAASASYRRMLLSVLRQVVDHSLQRTAGRRIDMKLSLIDGRDFPEDDLRLDPGPRP